jgi:hypothetical protein
LVEYFAAVLRGILGLRPVIQRHRRERIRPAMVHCVIRGSTRHVPMVHRPA